VRLLRRQNRICSATIRKGGCKVSVHALTGHSLWTLPCRRTHRLGNPSSTPWFIKPVDLLARAGTENSARQLPSIFCFKLHECAGGKPERTGRPHRGMVRTQRRTLQSFKKIFAQLFYRLNEKSEGGVLLTARSRKTGQETTQIGPEPKIQPRSFRLFAAARLKIESWSPSNPRRQSSRRA
jgi:hypothetical protein